ncbi:MAG: hypothetical protein MN733_44205, partial [Nitrososphaera sp.]|nr:hypothetical protein [Nitrososphaera sp.]
EQSRKLPHHLVLLVHGTFAHSNDDVGDAWWQRGSTCWNGLKVRLPEAIGLQEEGSLFRWGPKSESDPNSESARRRAAVSLLDTITALEDAETYYHLVGHSHGGSVIWDALREAERTAKQMTHLVSITTVGTPFIHFGLVRTSLFYEFRAAVIGLTLGYLILWVSVGLVPELFRLSYVGVVAALIGFLIFTYLCLGIFSLGTAAILDAQAVKKERELSRRSFLKHGSKWLGLWSPDDEAINGLRRSLALDVHVVRPKPSPMHLYSI